MKRLFALIGITYLSVQTVLFYLQLNIVTVVVAVVGLIGVLISTFAIKRSNRKYTAIAFCLTAAVASSIFGGYDLLVKKPIVDKYSDKEINITASIIEAPITENSVCKYILKTESVNGRKENVKISLTTSQKIKVDEFDKIICSLPVVECGKKQMLADKVFLQSVMYDKFDYTVVKSENKPLYYYAIKVREGFADNLESFLEDDCASLCRAVLLGEKTALSQEILNDFTRCGVSFLIVVSGMHFAIICSFVYFCINKVVKNRIARSSVMILCGLIFMAITGFSSSVVRAGVMLFVVYLGKMFMRKGDSLNSLGIAGLILTLPNPLAVADVGMLLSFSATLGIILWAQPITDFIMIKLERFKRLKKPIEFVINLFAVSISASIWTLPFSVLIFGRLSVFSVLLSIILSPVVSLLIASALLLVIFSSISFVAVLAYPFAFLCSALSKFVLYIVAIFSSIPFSSINACKPYFYVWLGLCVVLAVAGYFVKRKAEYAVKSVVAAACVLTIGFAVYSVVDVNTTVMNVYATDGNTVVIRRGKNCSVISCNGSTRNIFDAVSDIMEENASLDFIIVPSDRESDLVNAKVFERTFDESAVLIYDSKDESKNSGKRKYFSTGQSFKLNLNSNTVDEVISTKSGVYQYITVNDTTVLILESKIKSDDILEKHRQADYIITNKKSDNLQVLNGNCIIFTNSSSEDVDFEESIFIDEENLSIKLD